MLLVCESNEQLIKEEGKFPLETSLLFLYPVTEANREADIDERSQAEDGGKARPFVLVLPGGGYTHLAQHEGEPIARWLNSLGIHAGVLHYQVGDFEFTDLIKDVEDALQWVREAPKAWNVIPDQVGMIGSSAGGHLASITATTGTVKPNLLLLCYPVISLHDPYTHEGSRRKFLGANPPRETLDAWSSDQRVAPDTPPTFIWMTADDSVVPVENSLLFAAALSRHKVPFELHIFEEGRHGLGLAGDHAHVRQWLRLAENWLDQHHYVKKGLG
ncbi:alpha/beta hydrolase [Paenibacillus ihumii]|uniref:alpha/beta hydrolase n=1 Tax=Paenibacillus ihumii TaxID=687436 RepID=UPI0006D84798|nr:alpha/beta hydrolase [Paenibacillus ihumii]